MGNKLTLRAHLLAHVPQDHGGEVPEGEGVSQRRRLRQAGVPLVAVAEEVPGQALRAGQAEVVAEGRPPGAREPGLLAELGHDGVALPHDENVVPRFWETLDHLSPASSHLHSSWDAKLCVSLCVCCAL